MIGKLRGKVDSVENDYCVIDVNGVGYVAYCPSSTLATLDMNAPETVLLIDTIVREDMIRLYGFRSSVEREWFRLLQAHVQGVGAKVALSVLSELAPAELAAAVISKDLATVSRAKGVGKKVAERIVSEMQGKVPAGSGGEQGTAPLAPKGKAAEEALSALVNLGYDKAKASAAISAALEQAGEEPDSALLIRLGLKAAAR